MKVLVAEDEPVSRRVVEATLKGAGYDVRVCSDGSEAWSVIQHDASLELAVLDWMMPGLDGVELCRRIRKMRVATPTYIILLTARGHAEDIVRGIQAGTDDYITKPFDRDDLLTRVQVGEWLVKMQKKGLKYEASPSL